jgi:predicted AAA+ superfamily ATPase
LHYWRTKSGNEVDFVLYGRDAFCAIEVKNFGRLKESMVNGLLAFKADYPEAETRLVYRGRDRIKIKGVGAADKAVIQLVRVQPYQLPDSDT